MRLVIILVGPARAENIGAAARAMKTMGFSEMRIVDSEAHRLPAARYVAHGSTEIIDNIEEYPDLAAALHDVDFTVATTARSRAQYHYYATPQQLLPLLEEKGRWLPTLALVFGREDSGLTNEELALADILTGVPMAADYPSLNLGQAVMVYCYQLSGLLQVEARPQATADAGQLRALRQRIARLLTRLAVADDLKLSAWLEQRIGLLAQRDTAMLHQLLHDIEKKLPDDSPENK